MPFECPPLQFDAYSLTSCLDAVDVASEILSGDETSDLNTQISSPIWFRGQTKSTYVLLPTLLRNNKLTYLETKLAEESRTQEFAARAYHIIDEKPRTHIEWQEIMQHYDVKTRLMDWSENVYTALLFALEPFISDPGDDRFKYKRRSSTPSLWMLNPVKLNEIVYTHIAEDTAVIRSALSEYTSINPTLPDDLSHRLTNGRKQFLSVQGNPRSGIVSLSRLEDLRSTASNRLSELLTQNRFNPFFYMLLKIYSDGIPIDNQVPPLAVVHPYHSKRIETQHGVFTIFPFPPNNGTILPFERIESCYNCLCEIRLHNPLAIAYDLRKLGFKRTDLYPELSEYGRSIEWR